jgi:glycosyltransferase involved in cell wall biosynthesis
MKVLIVHDRFGFFGGAESNIYGVARALEEKGHLIAILHGAGTGQGEEQWRRAFGHRFPLNPRAKCESIQAALWGFEPEVVFVHKMADLDVLQMLSGCGLPIVRMVHDHDMYCMRSYKYDWWSRRICTRPASLYCVLGCGACLARNRGGGWPLRWVSYRIKRKEIALNRTFSKLVVASDYMKQELLRNGFNAAQICIHAPVPRSAETRNVSSFSSRNLIVYSGQIIRGKGVDVLLRALSRVTAPFECMIFGDGNHRAYCERLAGELGLADRVRFAGFVPQEELQGYFAEASVAVMSSVWPEPFGAAGLEAMRYGLPVVAFDAGAVKEWLIDGVNGFLAPWMDTATFAARIDALLADKSLAKRLGENARVAVNEQFEFSRYISGLEELLEQTGKAKAEEVGA